MKKSSAKPASESAGTKATAPPRTLAPRTLAPRTFAIDIGGSGIKALTLDPAGKPINERMRTATPKNARPKDVIAIVRKLAKAQPGFERVSVGFPGVVKDGLIYTAANLGKGWAGFDLRAALERKLKKPVRVANDADIQGLGCVTGHGLELVITLGTGFGSVLFADGTRVHLELGHHPFHRGRTYEDELGERALEKKGRKYWIKMLQEAIAELQRTFNYDRLYIGGGNSRLVNFKLPAGVRIISNEDGLLGGIALWRDVKWEAPKPAVKPASMPVKLPASRTPPKPPSRIAAAPASSATPKPAASVRPKPAPAPTAKPMRAAVAKPPPVAPKAAESRGGASSGTSPTPPANGSTQSSAAPIKKSESGPSPTS
jgi:polyphosphate glucokinase